MSSFGFAWWHSLVSVSIYTFFPWTALPLSPCELLSHPSKCYSFTTAFFNQANCKYTLPSSQWLLPRRRVIGQTMSAEHLYLARRASPILAHTAFPHWGVPYESAPHHNPALTLLPFSGMVFNEFTCLTICVPNRPLSVSLHQNVALMRTEILWVLLLFPHLNETCYTGIGI
jgi:hypothetical protein